MKYELIIFDIDETLMDFKKTEQTAVRSCLLDAGVDYDEEIHLKVYKEINSKLWKELEEGKINQHELNFERFEKTIDYFNLDFDPEIMADNFIHYASETAFLYDGALELVKKVKEKYKTAVITNGFSKIQNGRLKLFGLFPLFDGIVISEEVKCSKPDKKIFEYTFEMMNITDPKTCLIIGDSLNSDIQGGINAGIDTCWFNPSEKPLNEDIVPTYTVKNYEEILDVL